MASEIHLEQFLKDNDCLAEFCNNYADYKLADVPCDTWEEIVEDLEDSDPEDWVVNAFLWEGAEVPAGKDADFWLTISHDWRDFVKGGTCND